MPPRKRQAEAAPETERPAKRQTRSSGKATRAPSPPRPVPRTRRASATTNKRAVEPENHDDSSEVEVIEPPTKPPTRTRSSKTQPANDPSLSDETNLVRKPPAKTEPKPRRGRPPKKVKDVEEQLVDERVAPSETVVAEASDASPDEKPAKPPGKGKKVATQTRKRGQSSTIEVVVPRARAGKSRPSTDATNINEMDVDEAASEVTLTTTPKKRRGRPPAKSKAREVPDEESAPPPKATSSRATRGAKSQAAPSRSSVEVVEVEEVQTSRRTTKARGARSTAKPPATSKKDAYSDAAEKESPAEEQAASDTQDIDYRSLFGSDEDEETENMDPVADEQTPADDTTAHRSQRRVHKPSDSASLPSDLQASFIVCQKAVLKQLTRNTIRTQQEETPNFVAIQELTDLIDGTVHRAEGNSCLVLGPRGSGKSCIIDSCLEKVAGTNPIILRLSGWVQTSDRHALREIAYQLLQQTGSSLLPDSAIEGANEDTAEFPTEDNGEENPFLEHAAEEPIITLPPSSHLHSLIPVLLTLNRPVIVILDAFDLFALHPRQSLLYCLLDTVQSCRASSGSSGLAVVGVTSRVDTVQLLEKRVKSRFSGRTIRTAPPGSFDEYQAIIRDTLLPSRSLPDETAEQRWNELWTTSVDKFLADKATVQVLRETYCLTRNLKVILRVLTSVVVRLTPQDPYLMPKQLAASTDSQRSRPSITHLGNLSYPWLCLLISGAHSMKSGHDNFTFEMLHDAFRKQLKDSASAPVQVNGANIGMMRCSRAVLMNAFEEMVSAKIFVCSVAPASTVGKEFVKYRCAVLFGDIKPIVERSGLTNLKKWLTKANEINQSS